MNSRINRKIKKQMIVLVFGGHIGAPQGDILFIFNRNELFLIEISFFF